MPGKCISLFAASRLANVTAGTGIIPPGVHGSVKQAHEGQKCKGDMAEFAEESLETVSIGIVRTLAGRRPPIITIPGYPPCSKPPQLLLHRDREAGCVVTSGDDSSKKLVYKLVLRCGSANDTATQLPEYARCCMCA